MGIPMTLTKNLTQLVVRFFASGVSYNAPMNQRTAVGISILSLALLIALFQYLASAYYLYWVWWWADIVMHFLGGLLIGGAVLWWIRYEIPMSIRMHLPVFLTTFLAVVSVGVLWELFELFTDSYSAINYTVDTASDLGMDVVGMLVAYGLFKRFVL